MFWAIISPIFRSTRLCVTACGIMHRRCCRPVNWMRWNCIPTHPAYRPSEDGRNYRPKYVELIGIINKPLLLHLVGWQFGTLSGKRAGYYGESTIIHTSKWRFGYLPNKAFSCIVYGWYHGVSKSACGSRDSVVGTDLATGWTIRGSNPNRGKTFSIL